MHTDMPEPPPAHQTNRLGDVAYEELRDRLMRGTYRPGNRLTVRSVADDLGVSSTPARDAINRLAIGGALIYSGPKTVVVPTLTEEALREITCVRIALESLAAEQAIRNGAGAILEQLQQFQLLINSSLDAEDYQAALAHNKDFHFSIYRLSGFDSLIGLIEGQWLRVGPSFHDLYPEFATERYGVRNHEMAMEAIATKDAAALRAAVESDIRDGSRSLHRAILNRKQGAR